LLILKSNNPAGLHLPYVVRFTGLRREGISPSTAGRGHRNAQTLRIRL